MRKPITPSPKETKMETVQRMIRTLAEERGPAAKLPTIEMLCDSYDTSRATINDALERLETLDIIYRQRGSGIFVSPTIFQTTVALLLGDVVFNERAASPFWNALWSQLVVDAQNRSTARADAFSLHTIHHAGTSSATLDPYLKQVVEGGRASGVLGVGVDSATANWIKSHDIPVISFAGDGSFHVTTNNARLIREATRYLLDEGCHNVRLWFLGEDFNLTGGSKARIFSADEVQKYATPYYDELESVGLSRDSGKAWALTTGTESDRLQRQGALAVERLVKSGEVKTTDGIVIANDMIALGALKQMTRYRECDAIRIVSHVNVGTSVLYAFDERIARIEFDPAEISGLMYKLLDDVMAGNAPADYTIHAEPSPVRPPKPLE